MTSLLGAALDYAARGWPVFPCEPRGKRPLGRLVPHGLKEAATDPRVIERWWKAAPGANIGLLTGIAFDVLDVDGDDGMAALAVEMPPDGATVDGPTVTTGKGAHVYVLPTGTGNRAGFIPGCDWRGQGGYVVAPPSIHPSGATYAWKAGRGDPGFGADAPILPAPRWLLDLLAPPPVTPTAVPVNISRGDGYAKAALRGECEEIALAPAGTRNHRLNVGAFKIATLIAAGLLDADECAAALLGAAASCGLPESEARKTIASGFRAGLAQPRRVAS